jgi:hypothetical protein
MTNCPRCERAYGTCYHTREIEPGDMSGIVDMPEHAKIPEGFAQHPDGFLTDDPDFLV